MQKKAWHILILVFALWVSSASAADFSSDNFVVKDPILSIGGAFGTSTSFSLHASLGQEAIGISASDAFGLRAGFLYFPSPAVAGTSTPPPPPIGGFYGRNIEVALISARLCDFNSDGRCNIFDLSIFLYWLDRPREANSPFDLNGDGRLDIVDVSLIFYYWI